MYMQCKIICWKYIAKQNNKCCIKICRIIPSIFISLLQTSKKFSLLYNDDIFQGIIALLINYDKAIHFRIWNRLVQMKNYAIS